MNTPDPKQLDIPKIRAEWEQYTGEIGKGCLTECDLDPSEPENHPCHAVQLIWTDGETAKPVIGLPLEEGPLKGFYEYFLVPGDPDPNATIEALESVWLLRPSSNASRAHMAEKYLKAFYADSTGEFADGELEIAARDFISDLLHLCDREKWDFADMESMARENYLEEIDPLRMPEPTHNKA